MTSILYIIILQIIELIIYTFHISVLILLYRKQKTLFKGPFYNILRNILVIDVLVFVASASSTRLGLFEPFTTIFKTNGSLIASILYNSLSYLTVVQYIGHMLLSCNRFTLLWFPLRHEIFWKKQWYAFIMFGIPFLHICYRIHEPGMFIFSEKTVYVVAIALVNTKIGNFAYVSAFIIGLSTTFLSAIFNIMSLIKVYSGGGNNNTLNININEKRLLFLTCFIFIAQLLRTFSTTTRALFTLSSEVNEIFGLAVPLTNDAFAWAGSISLILLSVTVRKEYMILYFCRHHQKIAVPKTHITMSKIGI